MKMSVIVRHFCCAMVNQFEVFFLVDLFEETNTFLHQLLLFLRLLKKNKIK